MVLFRRAQRLFLCWGLMGVTFGGIRLHRSLFSDWNAQSDFRLKQVTSSAPTNGPPLVPQGPPPPPFRILCTATPVVMGWGSFRIRCRDFKQYAESYFGPQVQIDVISATEAMGHYNATIMVKVTQPGGQRVPPLTKIASQSNGTISFGNIFIDVVDNYNLDDKRIPQSYHVIVQNDLHAQEVFANRSAHLVHVVPHWFNSFVADVESETPVLPAPVLKKKPSSWARKNDPHNNLTIAMIWNPRAPDYEHAAQVVSIPETGYTFLPMNFEFDIGTWFPDLQGSPYAPNAMGQNESIAAMLADPARGEPYLYLTLFRKYDVLMILGKSDPNKDRYNSVQRAISQMRSGIPVLLECVPAQAHLCVDYPCGFSTADEMKAALERMKNVKVRQECARKGVEMTKRYTPRKVIDDYLTELGLPPEKRLVPH